MPVGGMLLMIVGAVIWLAAITGVFTAWGVWSDAGRAVFFLGGMVFAAGMIRNAILGLGIDERPLKKD